MKNLVAKESIEAVAVKEENIMETQIAVGKEAFSKEVVLRNIAQTDIRLQKLLGYRNYDFYDPKLFMLGLKDGETISEALLRRGAYNIGQVKTRSTRYKNCYTDYFMYPDNESTVVAVVYNNEGVGIPTLLDYEDYAKYFKDENLLWSSIFVTLMANKIGGLQFGIYRNCQISSRVFHTAVAALPLTKANRSDFE
ncbi:hypothetical protein [Mediterraneibacter gnavus]|uniref:hypothetical protein n=1 Tax=Mediterraneibacter gnavus TaxID=33038 RepID=UPI0036D40864